jgi:hypothetical protein
MTLGTAIFLSSVVLGIVILFISTKDRWNWKKIILWPILVVVSISILLGVGYYIYQSISNRPKPQTTFLGISLDSTKGDIKFLKGEPIKGSDDKFWSYSTEQGKSSFFIIFKDSKIWVIGYDGEILYGNSLQGVYIGASYDEIIKKFGQPSFVSISEEELERILSYDKYNVFFVLKENRVISYGIYNKTLGPFKYRKEKKAD